MTEAAESSLDPVDDAILNELAIAYTLVDPPPADLDDRVLFAVALRHLDAEVARVRDEELIGTGARDVDRPRTITFESEHLTVMMTVVARPDGRRRVDGWIAPAAALRVELRISGSGGSADRTHAVTADDSGRFALDNVRPGLAQLVVYGPRSTVVTPSVVL
jgi:hypothetical protein